MEVESSLLASRYLLAHEPETGYAFIGYSPRGLVLRASYFDGMAFAAARAVAQITSGRDHAAAVIRGGRKVSTSSPELRGASGQSTTMGIHDAPGECGRPSGNP